MIKHPIQNGRLDFRPSQIANTSIIGMSNTTADVSNPMKSGDPENRAATKTEVKPMPIIAVLIVNFIPCPLDIDERQQVGTLCIVTWPEPDNESGKALVQWHLL